MAWSDLPPRPNILLIITDQQRYAQHWPAGWVAANLPSMQRLLSHGLSFTHAFTAACECSPSRAAFLTSTYDNTNRVSTTPPGQNLPTPPGLPNLGSILAAGGYQVAWKGKWHLLAESADNLSGYDFGGWDPPDAGTSLGPNHLGGGSGATDHNDPRFTADAIEFLETYTSTDPFCLVVSLVNPHDVHVYTQNWASVGYPPAIPDLGIGEPDNYFDPLTDKPRAQLKFRQAFDASASFKLSPPLTPAGYAGFYAYLHTVVDAQISLLLDALDAAGFTDNTLVVRMGDHGEMGLSHGLREKMYVAYDEAIRVPLVFSNPLAFPQPQESGAMASLLDLVPTLAAVAGAAPPPTLMGRNLAPVLADPASSVQDGVLYSYDDSSFLSQSPGFATNIRALRTKRWLYAVYFSKADPATIPLEFELYDLEDDPVQMINLLSSANYQPSILPRWQALNQQLWDLADALESTPPGFTPPASGSLGPGLLDAAAKAAVRDEDLVLALEGK